jgi:hypothetical protein
MKRSKPGFVMLQLRNANDQWRRLRRNDAAEKCGGFCVVTLSKPVAKQAVLVVKGRLKELT